MHVCHTLYSIMSFILFLLTLLTRCAVSVNSEFDSREGRNRIFTCLVGIPSASRHWRGTTLRFSRRGNTEK